jgi:hypothetical protein
MDTSHDNHLLPTYVETIIRLRDQSRSLRVEPTQKSTLIRDPERLKSILTRSLSGPHPRGVGFDRRGPFLPRISNGNGFSF